MEMYLGMLLGNVRDVVGGVGLCWGCWVMLGNVGDVVGDVGDVIKHRTWNEEDTSITKHQASISTAL